MKIPRALSFCGWLGLMLGILGGIQLPATAADKISFWYSALEFSVDINDLEKNLEIDLETPIVEIEGNTFTEVHKEVNFINSSSTPKTQWQSLLTREIRLDRVTVSRLLHSALGTRILHSIGEIIRVSPQQNGFYALRSALILAPDSSGRFTLLDVIRQFPAETINIDAQVIFKLVDVFGQLQTETQKEIVAIKEQAAIASQSKSVTDFTQQPDIDIRNPGYFTWHQENLTLYDQKRDRSLAVTLYRPQTNFDTSAKIPLVIISPGFSAEKEQFRYLAEHLTSYGMAVAILDHPGSDYTQVENFLAGTTKEILTAQELINRPQDVSYLLDELQRKQQVNPSSLGKLNLEKVGIIGHSIGSYTALALGGAKLDLKQLQQYCSTKAVDSNWFNPSMVVQCLAAKLLPTKNYQLSDRRITAIFAMNPFSSKIFGKTGLNQLRIPIAFVGGSQDLFTPILSEQIEPFAWLGSRQKYLLLIDRGTHTYHRTKLLKTLAINTTKNSFKPQLARGYIKVMSLAFMQTHITHQVKYRRFLTNNYARYISQNQMKLNLVNYSLIKSNL
jgi:predicted dienelactone hydrolase